MELTAVTSGKATCQFSVSHPQVRQFSDSPSSPDYQRTSPTSEAYCRRYLPSCGTPNIDQAHENLATPIISFNEVFRSCKLMTNQRYCGIAVIWASICSKIRWGDVKHYNVFLRNSWKDFWLNSVANVKLQHFVSSVLRFIIGNTQECAVVDIKNEIFLKAVIKQMTYLFRKKVD